MNLNSRRNRSSSGVFVRSGEELSMENVIKQTKLASSTATPFTGTLTNKLSFRGSGKCKSPTSSTLFNNITLSLPNSSNQSKSQYRKYAFLSRPNVPLIFGNQLKYVKYNFLCRCIKYIFMGFWCNCSACCVRNAASNVCIRRSCQLWLLHQKYRYL